MDTTIPDNWPEVSRDQFFGMLERGRGYRRKAWYNAIEYVDLATERVFAYEVGESAEPKKYIIHPDLVVR